MKDSHAATADLAVHGCQRRDCEVGDTVREVLLRVEVPDQKLVRWEMLVLAICMLAHVACLGGRARCRRSLLGFALTLGGDPWTLSQPLVVPRLLAQPSAVPWVLQAWSFLSIGSQLWLPWTSPWPPWGSNLSSRYCPCVLRLNHRLNRQCLAGLAQPDPVLHHPRVHRSSLFLFVWVLLRCALWRVRVLHRLACAWMHALPLRALGPED